MRCRNIKYEFFIHDKLPNCEPLARLLFIGLWCMGDSAGRMEERIHKIRMQLLPCDACDIASLLGQLEKHGFIIRYTVDDVRYIQVVNFLKHQHPHFKEPPSKIPPPAGYVDERPQRLKPRASPGHALDMPEADPRPALDKPEARPSDTLIADTLIPESSLISDSRKHARKQSASPPIQLTRLSFEALPPDWAQWTQSEMGWGAEAMQDVWIYFRDYWQSRTGKSAQKSDWSAIWRNWCRQQNIRNNGGKHAATFNHTTQGARPSKSERFKHALIDSTCQELGT
jgi:hypothetical protein